MVWCSPHHDRVSPPRHTRTPLGLGVFQPALKLFELGGVTSTPIPTLILADADAVAKPNSCLTLNLAAMVKKLVSYILLPSLSVPMLVVRVQLLIVRRRRSIIFRRNAIC
jgi:hypothetical protein